VEGALNGFSDHDELYWHAIGTQWAVPIARATARVVTPAPVTRATCFVGPSDSRQPCANGGTDGATAFFSEADLAAGEGLTLVVGFPTGAVPRPLPILDERWSVGRAFSVTPVTAGLAAILGLAAVILLRRLRRLGTDIQPKVPASGSTSISALPQDIRPGMAGLLLHEDVRPIDITATIVDLARRGYVHIEEVPRHRSKRTDWRIVAQKPPDEDLLPYERVLVDRLFVQADGKRTSSVTLSSLAEQFSEKYDRVCDALYDEAMRRRWFAGRPDEVRRFWLLTGGAVFILGVIMTVLAAWLTHLGLVPLPLVPFGLALAVGATRMPRRTAVGADLARRVAAYRTQLQDSAPLPLTASAGTGLLAASLPYVMVFGLTERSQHALSESAVGWYHGQEPFRVDDFSRSSEDALTSPPTSSSSGSDGGSSGGSSGGGGGGGGGGSW